MLLATKHSFLHIITILGAMGFATGNGNVTCRSDTFVEGSQAFVECNFGEDIRKTRRNLNVVQYTNASSDAGNFVLLCNFVAGKTEPECTSKEGYTFNKTALTNILTLQITSVQTSMAGMYVCQVVDPDLNIIPSTCNLNVTASTTTTTTTSTTTTATTSTRTQAPCTAVKETACPQPQKPQTEEKSCSNGGLVAVVVIMTLFLLAVIGLLLYIWWNFALVKRRPKRKENDDIDDGWDDVKCCFLFLWVLKCFKYRRPPGESSALSHPPAKDAGDDLAGMTTGVTGDIEQGRNEESAPLLGEDNGLPGNNPDGNLATVVVISDHPEEDTATSLAQENEKLQNTVHAQAGEGERITAASPTISEAGKGSATSQARQEIVAPAAPTAPARRSRNMGAGDSVLNTTPNNETGNSQQPQNARPMESQTPAPPTSSRQPAVDQGTSNANLGATAASPGDHSMNLIFSSSGAALGNKGSPIKHSEVDPPKNVNENIIDIYPEAASVALPENAGDRLDEENENDEAGADNKKNETESSVHTKDNSNTGTSSELNRTESDPSRNSDAFVL